MFIGNKEIDREDSLSDGFVEVFFKDGGFLVLKNELRDMVVTKESSDADPRDVIADRICREFFSRMSDLGVDMSLTQKVLNGLRNLIDNIWNEGVAKKFNEKTTEDIKLKDLLFS